MDTIPLVNLKIQYENLKVDLDSSIFEVINSTQFILGKAVLEFEKEYASFCGVPYAVGLDSGLSALELGMRALGIGSGDEVITPANSFIASSSSISIVGAKPVLVDCDPKTYNIDTAKIESKITKKTKAIMPVHLYGQPANMDEITQIAEKHKLLIIEDSCQGHGATYKDKVTGSFGNFAAFSFYPGKNLGAFGDAGILTTNNEQIYQKVLVMRNYGQTKKYYHNEIAYNKRLDTIQAAILRTKLKHLADWNKIRQLIAQVYKMRLKRLPIVLPESLSDRAHAYHQFVIRTKRRDDLQKFLETHGISTGIHYPIPIHLQECYKDLGYKKGDFPITEEYANEILSLPMFPEITTSQIEYICKSIKEFFVK